LRMTDFVKFAKYQPGTEDNERSYQVIRQSVDHLNEIAEPEQTGLPGQNQPGRSGQAPGQPGQSGKPDKGNESTSKSGA